MDEQISRNIRLGLFVISGVFVLIIALYLVGTKQNMFGSTFRINAYFNNVNGLMKGNNVRVAGIDVGTVESVEIVSDSKVNVTMVIEKKVKKFIKKNALASIGTDGLMGNKLVNINSVEEFSEYVEEGDILLSIQPVEMDEMVRTLNTTNENVKVISGNLRNITDKISNKNSLWSVLMDTVVSDNVKTTLVNLKLMSNHGVYITGNLKHITQEALNGKGTIGALITDTILSSNIKQTIIKLEKLSDSVAIISGDVTEIVKNLKRGKGSVGVLLNDTMVVYNLNKSLEGLKGGVGKFDENMEALKHSWPFKKYFRKQKKLNQTK